MTITPDERFEQLQRSILNVRSVDLSRVTGEESTVAVGLLLAALDQVEVLAILQNSGHVSGVSPNRRLVYEIAIRLRYLLDHGEDALNSLKLQAKGDLGRLEKRVEPDLLSGFNDRDVINDFYTESGRGENLGSIAGFVDSVDDLKEFYLVWWQETNRSHASLHLAYSYVAPQGLGIKAHRPSGNDPDHELLMLMALLCVMSLNTILSRNGFQDEAMAVATAWVDDLAHGTPPHPSPEAE